MRAVSAEVCGLDRIIATLFLERQVTDLKKIYIYAMPEKGKKNFSSLCQKFQIDISTLPPIKRKHCHDWIRIAGGGNLLFWSPLKY